MKKNQKSTNNEPQTLMDAIRYYSDEAKCVELLSNVKWAGGEKCCPRCGSTNVVGMKTRPTFLCKEKGCKKQFSIKVGTIMEDSAIAITKWIPAIWQIVNDKNGISSYELGRSIGVTHKSAWFMLHRIREAVSNNSVAKFCGTTEADETFIGGLAKNMHKDKKERFKKNRRITGDKTAVMGILERGGEVRAQVVHNTERASLFPEIIKHVEPNATIYTDSASYYKKLNELFPNHQMIDHSAGQYVNGDCWTNGIENFWSLLKRSVKGTYIQISPFHLNSYVVEQSFRYNTRKQTDSERFQKAIAHIFGKRLTYAELLSRKNKFNEQKIQINGTK
jgi:transposase-like protein